MSSCRCGGCGRCARPSACGTPRCGSRVRRRGPTDRDHGDRDRPPCGGSRQCQWRRAPSRRRSPGRAAEEDEPRVVHRPHRVDVQLRVQAPREGVRRQHVQAAVEHGRRRSGDRVEHALHAGPDPFLSRTPSRRGCRLRRACEVKEMRTLGVVELQGASERFQNAFGDPAEVPSLEPGVVGNADAGEDRDFLPAQPRHTPGAVGRQTDFVWRELGPPGGQELSDLALGVHEIRVDPPGRRWGTLPVPPSTGTLTSHRCVLS